MTSQYLLGGLTTGAAGAFTPSPDLLDPTSVPGIIRRTVVAFARERGHVARAGGALPLTASGGTAQELTDAVGFDHAASSIYYRDWWIWNVTKDEYRQISEGSAPNWVHAGSPWAPPEEGDVYLVLRDSPVAWWQAVNTALSTLIHIRRYVEFTPLERRGLYRFGEAPLVFDRMARSTQVAHVEYRDAAGAEDSGIETPLDAPWNAWADGHRTARVVSDGATQFLDFGPFSELHPGPNVRLRLTLFEQVGPVPSLTDQIPVDELWAASATAMAMGATQGNPAVPGDAWVRITRQAAEFYAGRRIDIMGTDAYGSVQTTLRRGGAGVGGRRSRRR